MACRLVYNRDMGSRLLPVKQGVQAVCIISAMLEVVRSERRAFGYEEVVAAVISMCPQQSESVIRAEVSEMLGKVRGQVSVER